MHALSVLGALPGVPKDHEVDVQLAMLTSFTAIVVALIGFCGLYIQGRRHGSKLEETYRHVNNLEDNEAVPGGDPPTLGSLLRSLDRRVEAGFTENDAVHRQLGSGLQQLGDAVHQNGERLDQHRTDLNQIRRRVDRLDLDKRPNE